MRETKRTVSRKRITKYCVPLSPPLSPEVPDRPRRRNKKGVFLTDYYNSIRNHYTSVWGLEGVLKRPVEGPVWELPPDYSILEFPPNRALRPGTPLWMYATVGMSNPVDDRRLELHLLAPTQSDRHVMTLTFVAHYHRTGEPIWYNHTVNLGVPWAEGSMCDHALISKPYPLGSEMEVGLVCRKDVRFLWLLPITRAEREFARCRGVEALEQQFDKVGLEYWNPQRQSTV